MKTEIKINDKNLSRYAKRFQKVVSEHLGQEIKLNEAANLLAQVLGADSSFELNKILTKDLVAEFKLKIKDSKLSSLDKIILVTQQVQKMMLNTKAEFWYAIFTENGGDSSPFIGKPEFNGIEIYSDYIGFTPFNYNPVPEDDYWLSINEDLESVCIQYGSVDEDIDSNKNLTPFEEKDVEAESECIRNMANAYFIKKEIYADKKEVKLLKEMAEFCQELLWESVNETQHWKDFWLVERDKITIGFGDEIKVIKSPNSVHKNKI